MKTEDEERVWTADWEARILNRIRSRGFETLSLFFVAHPGLSYFELADLLSERGDVAAVQLQYLHAASAEDSGKMETMCDSLARFLRGALKRGWGLDKYWESAVAGAFASWTVMWEEVPWARKVVSQLFSLNPPAGWIPTGSTDAWVQKAIESANRKAD